MAHHKRKRPKHQRAGCLMCKPFKDERAKRSRKYFGGAEPYTNPGRRGLRKEPIEGEYADHPMGGGF